MYVVYLTKVYVHSSVQKYISKQYVQVVCMVHKLQKLVGNYKPKASSFWHRVHVFASGHSFVISSMSIDCWERFI